MGRRGVSHHARGAHPPRSFASLGVRCAVLGSNRSWTSFAIVADTPELGPIAEALGAAIVQIWSDDDLGSAVWFYAPDGWSAELGLDFDGGKPSAADRTLFAELVRRKILTANQRAKLEAKMRLGARSRATWLAGDGLESLLGVAAPEPLPVPCSAGMLATLHPGAKLVAARPVKPRPAKKVPAPPAPTVAVDPTVLAVHVHYWTEIFQMNGWKLYNRYKKHLPAERRGEVDRLCDLVATGDDPDELPCKVEAILAAVWTADDWVAAIRDPRLAADEPLDPDQLADWKRRLAAL
jgi:hypothetical protein